MKKVFLVFALLLFYIFAICIPTIAYVTTGHEDFSEIMFDDKNEKLLIHRGRDEIQEAYSNLKKGKLFGWRTSYFNINSKAKYVGETIFSRSNRTSKTFEFSYKINEETFIDKSVKINGSVSAKIAFGKKVDVNITPKVDAWYDKTETYLKEEQTSFEFHVLPNTKLTLRVSGDAYITSGVSGFYLFGVCLKKGEWERVEVETMYYELIEENLS